MRNEGNENSDSTSDRLHVATIREILRAIFSRVLASDRFNKQIENLPSSLETLALVCIFVTPLPNGLVSRHLNIFSRASVMSLKEAVRVLNRSASISRN